MAGKESRVRDGIVGQPENVSEANKSVATVDPEDIKQFAVSLGGSVLLAKNDKRGGIDLLIRK